MKSKIFFTRIYHSRLKPLKNTFTYDIFYYVFDLDELERGDLNNSLFGYNQQRKLISLNSEDYIGRDKSKTIKEKLKLQFQLEKNPVEVKEKSDRIERVDLITSPRYLNHAFNPVNFYYCYDKNDIVLQIVIEINNTFGETHIYFPLGSEITEQNQKIPLNNSERYPFHLSSNKVFHVSPFNSLDGIYDCYFSDINNQQFDIRINVISDINKDSLEFQVKDSPSNGNQHFDYIILTRLWSNTPPLEFNSYNLLTHIVIKYPISAFLTLPRIMYQAGLLHYQRKLKVYSKPNPPNNLNTSIVQPITPYQQKSKESVISFLSKFPFGHFKIHLPFTGNTQTSETTGFIEINNNKNRKSQILSDSYQLMPENLYSRISLNPIEINVQSNEFFVKLYKGLDKNIQGFTSRSIGLSYVANDFKCSDLPTLLFILCDLSLSTSNIVKEVENTYNDKSYIESIFSDLVHFIESPINLYSIFLDDENGYLCYDQSNNYEEDFNENNNNSSSSNGGSFVDDSQQQQHQQQVHLFSSIFNDLNFNDSSNCNFNILEIEPNWTKSLNGLFFNYLSERIDNFKYTIIISNKKKFNFISKLIKDHPSSKSIQILNIDFQDFCNYNNNNNTNKFNRIICVENLEESLLSIQVSTDRISYFLNQCNSKLIDRDCKSFIYLQSITGPYQQYQEIFNLKPKPEYSGLTYYQMFTSYLTSTTWTMLSEFQTNPFKLKDRYNYIMKLLSKNYINCHFESNTLPSSTTTTTTTTILEEIQKQKYFKIKELVNLDNYSQVLDQWLLKSQDIENLNRISILIQSFVKSNGCSLKMNQQEIDEIYLSIQFHLSILIASFKSVYSISKILLEN